MSLGRQRRPALVRAPCLPRAHARCNAGSDLQGDCGVNALLDIGEPRERTDVRVGWTSPQGTWSWAVYGNNIFDNQYVKGLNTYGRGPRWASSARPSASRAPTGWKWP